MGQTHVRKGRIFARLFGIPFQRINKAILNFDNLYVLAASLNILARIRSIVQVAIAVHQFERFVFNDTVFTNSVLTS